MPALLKKAFHLLCLVIVLLAPVAPLTAQASPQIPEKADPIVVTVSGKALPLSAVPASVIVVSRDDIESSHATNLAELLTNTPGVHVSQSGGKGALSSVSIRGGDPNFVLVLVDGVPLNDPNNSLGGGFDFSTMSLLNVDRIEIVRGPVSSMFGTDAMSGAINVITRQDAAASTTLVADGGSFGSASAQVLQSGVIHKFSYNAGAAYARTGEEIGKDDYALKSLSVHWALAIGPKSTLQWNSRLENTDAAGFPENGGGPLYSILRDPQSRRTRTAMGALEYAHELKPWWKARAQVDVFDSNQKLSVPTILDRVPPGPRTVPSVAATSDLLRTRFQIASEFQLKKDWSANVATGGYNEDGRSRGSLAGFLPASFDADRFVNFLTGELQYGRKGFNVSAGARTDFVHSFQTKVSPRVGFSFSPERSRDRLRFSWGRGFRLPSFYALGHPLVGNPTLRPEHSRSVEVGWTHLFPARSIQASVTLFDERYNDLIDFSASAFKLVNRSEAFARGVELEGAASPHPTLTVKAHTTYSRAELVGSDEPLRDRPRWRGGVQAIWTPAQQWRVRIDTIWVGARSDLQLPAPDKDTAPRYTESTFIGEYTRNHVVVFLKVQNVFNQKFQQFVGFPDPGRWFTAGLRWRL